jgi:hypothetical protein
MADSPEPLRVMTFNIRNSAAKDGDNDWAIGRICTQKRYAISIPTSWHARGPRGSIRRPRRIVSGIHRGRRRPRRWETGRRVVGDLLSQEPIRTSRFGEFLAVRNSDDVGSRSWDAACTRICTWARLRDRKSGREFLYANTHFDHKGVVARVESSKLIRQRLPVLAKGAPVILMGDFNCIRGRRAVSDTSRFGRKRSFTCRQLPNRSLQTRPRRSQFPCVQRQN